LEIIVVENYEELSEKGAKLLLEKIRSNKRINLGLATGSTPLGLYRKFIDFIKNESIDLSRIYTFNLDEYVGLSPNDQNSFHYYMKKHFYEPLHLTDNQTFIPNGAVDDIQAECIRYEYLIEKYGGIDFQLLGVGKNGHIGFNEPGTDFTKLTHEVELDNCTRQANARFFDSINDVPKKAITMGIGTILKSKEILLIANGQEKAKAIYQLVHGELTEEWPITALQKHDHVTVIVDRKAASFI
jgi:glucosamine-6-phosphate deaminase